MGWFTPAHLPLKPAVGADNRQKEMKKNGKKESTHKCGAEIMFWGWECGDYVEKYNLPDSGDEIEYCPKCGEKIVLDDVSVKSW